MLVVMPLLISQNRGSKRPDLIGLRGGECHSLLVCHLFPVTLGVMPQGLGALANLVLPWAMGL